MQKLILAIILILLVCLYEKPSSQNQPVVVPEELVVVPEALAAYKDMGLEELVSYDAFEQAYNGFKLIEGKQKELLTLIDFTKPSTEKRFFVLDLENREVLYHTYVSHGRNSGENYAASFSNRSGSYQSSLGFYLTEHTYQGKNGYSLVLEGLEKDINDRAKERAIVVHGAPYANPSTIRANGRLGRSLGCPALPQDVSKPIIDTIKHGSVLYIYAGNSDYIQQSPLLSMV